MITERATTSETGVLFDFRGGGKTAKYLKVYYFKDRRVLKKSKELFDSRKQHSMTYIHWKGNNHLDEGLNE